MILYFAYHIFCPILIKFYRMCPKNIIGLCRAIRSCERLSNIPDTQRLTVRTFVRAVNKITYARVS